MSKQTEDIHKYVRGRISGRRVDLLVDSGAKISLLNCSFVNSLWRSPRYELSNVKLSTYTGSPINVIGTVRLNVNFRSQELTSFPFHVVRSGNNLMGKDLFDALGFRISTPETESTLAIVFRRPKHVASSASQFGTNKSVQPTRRSVVVWRGEEGTQWRSTRARGPSTRYASSYSHWLLFLWRLQLCACSGVIFAPTLFTFAFNPFS